MNSNYTTSPGCQPVEFLLEIRLRQPSPLIQAFLIFMIIINILACPFNRCLERAGNDRRQDEIATESPQVEHVISIASVNGFCSWGGYSTRLRGGDNTFSTRGAEWILFF